MEQYEVHHYSRPLSPSLPSQQGQVEELFQLSATMQETAQLFAKLGENCDSSQEKVRLGFAMDTCLAISELSEKEIYNICQAASRPRRRSAP